jgi:hypothetical protein
MKEHSKNETNSAQDGFKKHCKDNNISCKRDTVFNDSHSAGKGDVPRNVSDKFKDNYGEIFPNSFEPKWMKDLKNE